MRLIYTATGKPVAVDDRVDIHGTVFVVAHMAPPHKAASEGKVTLRLPHERSPSGREYYVSVIGARWIERDDRPYHSPADAYEDFRIVYLLDSARQDVPATPPDQAWRDFLDRAIADGRAPPAAAGWSLRSALVPEGPDSADALAYGLSGTPFERLKVIGDAIEGDRASEAVIASFMRDTKDEREASAGPWRVEPAGVPADRSYFLMRRAEGGDLEFFPAENGDPKSFPSESAAQAAAVIANAMRTDPH